MCEIRWLPYGLCENEIADDKQAECDNRHEYKYICTPCKTEISLPTSHRSSKSLHRTNKYTFLFVEPPIWELLTPMKEQWGNGEGINVNISRCKQKVQTLSTFWCYRVSFSICPPSRSRLLPVTLSPSHIWKVWQ